MATGHQELEKVAKKFEKLSLQDNDTVVIAAMSHSAFLGTREDGLPSAHPCGRRNPMRMAGTIIYLTTYSSLRFPQAILKTTENLLGILKRGGGQKLLVVGSLASLWRRRPCYQPKARSGLLLQSQCCESGHVFGPPGSGSTS